MKVVSLSTVLSFGIEFSLLKLCLKIRIFCHSYLLIKTLYFLWRQGYYIDLELLRDNLLCTNISEILILQCSSRTESEFSCFSILIASYLTWWKSCQINFPVTVFTTVYCVISSWLIQDVMHWLIYTLTCVHL